MKRPLIASLLVAAVSGCSVMNSHVSSDYYRVADNELMKDSSWKTGAAVGGLVGAATSIGHGAESTAIRMVAGAAIGAGVEKLITRNSMRNEVRAVDAQGDLWVFEYDEHVVPGECLEVSRFARGSMVVRKADTAWCDFGRL